MLHALRTVALLALAGCGSTEPDGVSPAEVRVLFIGNSLTYTHDIPRLVASLSEQADGPRMRTAVVAVGGYGLEDHWRRGEALDSIARGGWSYVVLQQGPSTLPESRANLVEWTGRFAERIRAVNARPAVYMIWPSNGDFDGVSRSYRAAAAAVEGALIPAGEAFRAVARDHPDIPLFGGDGFHPSPAGSYLAALVIYGRLARRPTAGVGTEPPSGLAPGAARRLEAAADEANRPYLAARPRIEFHVGRRALAAISLSRGFRCAWRSSWWPCSVSPASSPAA